MPKNDDPQTHPGFIMMFVNVLEGQSIRQSEIIWLGKNIYRKIFCQQNRKLHHKSEHKVPMWEKVSLINMGFWILEPLCQKQERF